MSGRLAIRQGDRSDIAKLRWRHDAAGDLWVISSPLGNEVARIESNPNGATLRQASAAPESAESFQALTERLLGVALDPRAIAGWLHGDRPAGAGGWRVVVEETQKAGSIELARRISASRDDVVVRLVVDDYRVPGE